MDQAKLAGRTALITGAGAGIGKSIAVAFAGEGAAVVCADISFADAKRVAAGIVANGGRAAPCHCDVADPDQAQAAVMQAVREFGGLHVLVSNAAVLTPVASVEALSLEDWQHALAVNLTGAFLMSKYAIPQLRAAGGGNIILIASQMARVANAGQAAYCATKGALVQLAKGMALDHCEDNIRVNTLSPGGVATDRMARGLGIWRPRKGFGAPSIPWAGWENRKKSRGVRFFWPAMMHPS